MCRRYGCSPDGKARNLQEQGHPSACPDPTWFTDDVPDLNERKATGESLQGRFIVELGEMARILRATSDIGKAFVTRQVDSYRPSYGRYTKDFPRTCIFVGS